MKLQNPIPRVTVDVARKNPKCSYFAVRLTHND